MATSLSVRPSLSLRAYLRQYSAYRPCDRVIALLFFRDVDERRRHTTHTLGYKTALVESERLFGTTLYKITPHGALAVTLAHRHQHPQQRSVAAGGRNIALFRIGRDSPIYGIDTPERKREERTASGKQRIYVAFETYPFRLGKSVTHKSSLFGLRGRFGSGGRG